jgi:hypothetical protein
MGMRQAVLAFLSVAAAMTLAAFGVQKTEIAVFFPKIYPYRHRWLPSATIIHGPILLSLGHYGEPV